MGLQFGSAKVLDNFSSSLVFSMDPAVTKCFAGPATTNLNPVSNGNDGLSIYNNVPSHVTCTLNLTSPVRYYRGARIWVQTIQPTTATGVSYLTGANNPGIGVIGSNGGGPASTYTGHSIFYYPLSPLNASNPIFTHYSNISGWQSSNLYDNLGDGWYRAYNTWYDTVTRSDGKYWAINPLSVALNQTFTIYWAGSFKEQQPQNAFLGTYGSRAVNPYCVISRSASSSGTGGVAQPVNSADHGGIHDLSINQNHATINGTIVYDSDGGGSLIFNGSNTFIITESNAVGPYSTEFTLEAWAKTSTASGWQTVIGTENTLRQIGFLNNNFYAGGNGGGGNQFLSGGSGLSSNTWYHLCMTYDGQTAYLYLNGSLTNSGNIGALSGYPTPGRSMIGSYSTSGNELLNGKVSLAKIYNRALSATEVASNFTATRGRHGV